MCSRGKASGCGSSAPRGYCAAQEEKRSQSGEDSDESTKKTKKKKDLTKDPSAADAARKKMVYHLNKMWSLKCPLTSQPILPRSSKDC